VLLEAKASANARDRYDQTPLHLAARNGNAATVQALLEAKAFIDALDEEQHTPLYIAAQHGNSGALRVLLKAQASVDTLDEDHWTPLHAATEHGTGEVVRALLEAKAPVNARDNENCTPLHRATRRQAVIALLEAGALVDALNNDNETPLHITACYDFSDAVKELLEGGASVHARDKKNRTPLHIAAKQGWVETAQLLAEAGSDLSILVHDASLQPHKTKKDFIDKMITDVVFSHPLLYALVHGYSQVHPPASPRLRRASPLSDLEQGEGLSSEALAKEGIVNQLQEAIVNQLQEEAIVNQLQEEDIRQAFRLAAGQGLDAIVKIILGEKLSHCIDKKSYKKAIMNATIAGHASILSILLATSHNEEEQEMQELYKHALFVGAVQGYSDVMTKVWQVVPEEARSSALSKALVKAALQGRDTTVTWILERTLDRDYAALEKLIKKGQRPPPWRTFLLLDANTASTLKPLLQKLKLRHHKNADALIGFIERYIEARRIVVVRHLFSSTEGQPLPLLVTLLRSLPLEIFSYILYLIIR
jgi:ankyrin repeat protein